MSRTDEGVLRDANHLADTTTPVIHAVLQMYPLPQEIQRVQPLIQGHINATYRVQVADETGSEDLVIQRINDTVFAKPILVMENAQTIADHASRRQSSEDCGILQFLPSREGKNYTVVENGVWRISRFVPDSVAYDTVERPELLEQAAWAFGRFQWLLADLPAHQVHETIPEFHHTPKRLNSLFHAVQNDPVGRVSHCEDLINGFRRSVEQASILQTLRENGGLRERITHNDTKINNILLHKDTGRPLVILDLDTVMPGLVAHDFGDAIRTAGNTAREDEENTELVKLHWENFCAFSRGFLAGTQGILCEEEVKTLVLGAWTITVEQAARFLTDYLDGDPYFRTSYPDHNLVRARVQFRLVEQMEKNAAQMEQIVKDSLAG